MNKGVLLAKWNAFTFYVTYIYKKGRHTLMYR